MCIGGELGDMTVGFGQVWTLKAHYDFKKYPGIKYTDGSPERIGASAIMFVTKPNTMERHFFDY